MTASSSPAPTRGRTQLTALVNAALVILTLLFLMPFFQNLPQATLGAIVIFAMILMLDASYFRRLYRISRDEFWYASVAFLGELFLGTLPGVLLGVVLSLLVLIRRVTRPGTAVIGRMPDETFRDVKRYPEAETIPGLLIFRFDSVLFFSNADYFTDEVQEYVALAEVPIQQVLVNVSREGARQAAADGGVIDIDTYLAESSITGALTQYEVNGVTVSDPSGADYGDAVTVRISVPFKDVSWLPAPDFLNDAILSTSTTMRRETARL